MASLDERAGCIDLLPLVVGRPKERADAARNRVAVLDAAYAIMAEHGVAALTMDRVAAKAGVGIGTVYRRFEDRSGLAYALLDERERRFQEAFMFGPPPLGPGAPPSVRIRAFLHTYIVRLESEAELFAVAEARAPTARYASGAYWTTRVHLVGLLTESDAGSDPAYLADALLAIAGAGLFLHQRRELGYSADRLKAGIDQLLTALLPV